MGRVGGDWVLVTQNGLSCLTRTLKCCWNGAWQLPRNTEGKGKAMGLNRGKPRQLLAGPVGGAATGLA